MVKNQSLSLCVCLKKINVYITKKKNKLLKNILDGSCSPLLKRNLFYFFNKVIVQIIRIYIVLLNMDAIIFKCCSILMYVQH